MSKTNKGINEEKTTAASYIITFYQEIMSLNNLYSAYENLFVELEAKFPSEYEDMMKLEDGEKEQIKNAVQNIRFQINKTYLLHESIRDSLTQETKEQHEELKTSYKKRLSYIIKVDDVRSYTEKINKILVNNIMKSLLDNAESIVNDLYNKPKTE